MIIIVFGLLGCNPVDICYGKVPDDATMLEMNEIPWDSGPEYDTPQGWTEQVYSSQEEWDDFLTANDVEPPNFSVDFSLSDVLLYERQYNGCNFEVVFDGAYLWEGSRYVRTQVGDFDAHYCDIYENRHAILVLEKVTEADLSFCDPQ